MSALSSSHSSFSFHVESSSSSTSTILRGTALRRQLVAELGEIQRVLDQLTQPDEMTQTIAQWHEHFKTALRSNVDEESILSTFVELLQQILVDSIFNCPLDRYSFLGSDGNTYGQKALCIYLSAVPTEFRTRSPSDPENPSRFTVEPHPTVPFLLDWLEKHQGLLPSPDLDLAYQELVNRQAVPEVPLRNVTVMPSGRRERNFQILRIQAERDRQLNQEVEQFSRHLEGLRAERIQEDRQAFASLEARIDQQAHRSLASIETIKSSTENQLQILHQKIDQLSQEIDHLERRNEQLHQHLQSNQAQISQTKKDNIRLEISINETKKAVKKRKKRGAKDFVKVLEIVGTCALGTWALQGLVTTAGSTGSAAILPSSNGAKIGLSFAF